MIAQLLDAGDLSYREIAEAAGASTTTVTRVARFLREMPYQGYRRVLDRLRACADERRPRTRLTIAIQKAGRLADKSLDLIASAGLRVRQGRERSAVPDRELPDRPPARARRRHPDLRRRWRRRSWHCRAQRAGGSAATSPSAGSDRAARLRPLRVEDRRARGRRFDGPASLAGARIATTYPNLLARLLAEHGIDAEIVTMNGAVEVAPRLKLAQAICDLVSTGATLEANGLVAVATVLESEAVLVRTPRPIAARAGDAGRKRRAARSRASSPARTRNT